MCIPKPQLPGAMPEVMPSMQAANAFQAGGDQNRGAAQLGRLQLRLGGPTALTASAAGSSAVQPASTTPTPATVGGETSDNNLASSASSWLPGAGTAATQRIAGFGLGR